MRRWRRCAQDTFSLFVNLDRGLLGMDVKGVASFGLSLDLGLHLSLDRGHGERSEAQRALLELLQREREESKEPNRLAE